ncbi:GNAT family N-acetyltransferase [Flavobacteriaceae bacterium D16]|nr:GNAT family N-acetyltransferase [Flavobacteriaceae bacterium D16]
MDIGNLFTSTTFVNIWNKHFNKTEETFLFSHLSNITFVKPSFLPVYVNVGKRFTQGLTYNLVDNNPQPLFSNNVYLIYDVPSREPIHELLAYFEIKEIKQYEAYLINLRGYGNIDEYLKNQFSSNRRWQLRSALKKFENAFNTSFEVVTGKNVTKERHHKLFKTFYQLLLRRYNSKGEDHVFLNPKRWEYLKDLAYTLITEEKAGLFILYANNKPVAINLNYLSDGNLILGLPVFDIDYDRFKIGHITTLKTLQWCLDHGISSYDLSKGYYKYKEQWGNLHYNFYYHVIFDKRSFWSSFIGYLISYFFLLKGWLRFRILPLFRYFKNILSFKAPHKKIPYKILDDNSNSSEMVKVSASDYESKNIIKPLNDFLFKYSENFKAVEVFQLNENTFLFKSEQNCSKVCLPSS